MKYAIYDHLLHVGREKFPGNRARIELIHFFTGHLCKVTTMYKAKCQHTTCGVVTIDFGRCKELEVSDLLTNDASVVSLQAEVKLLVQAAFQLTHHEHDPITFAERGVLRGEASYLVQDFN